MRYFRYWIWNNNDVLMSKGPHIVTIREDVANTYWRWGWVVVQVSHAEADL